jgi:hypothetical protein
MTDSDHECGECPECGACVKEAQVHALWHESLRRSQAVVGSLPDA